MVICLTILFLVVFLILCVLKSEMDSQENQIVENQLHRSLLSFNGDNFAKIIQWQVDGVVLGERQEIKKVDEGNQEKSVLILTRFIGEKKYEVQVVAVGGDIVEENVVQTNLPDEDISKFNEEWEEKWYEWYCGEEGEHHFLEFAFRSGKWCVIDSDLE